MLWLIPFLPLFGAILNGATGRWLKNTKLVDAIALGSVALSFLLVLYCFTQLLGQAPGGPLREPDPVDLVRAWAAPTCWAGSPRTP